MILKNRSGQIWIETVIYTLIGLALIGLVLAILTPKIKEFKDKTVIEETISLLNIFDSKINDVLAAPGNKRKIQMTIDKGTLGVNSTGDSFKFVLVQSRVKYSEPGITIGIGRINVTTEIAGENYKVTLELNYNHNLTFGGQETDVKEFTPATIPYNIFIENKGLLNGKYVIDLSQGN